MNRPAFSSLTDVRFLVALALLVANDRVLKQAWPGFVTGKLSDVVGPVVAATIAVVGLRVSGVDRLVGRSSSIGIGAIVALMVAINTSSSAAGFAAAALSITGWSQSMVVDPTDLLGLVGLLAVPAIVDRPRPLSDAPVAKALALGVGAVACTATSAIPNPSYDAIATDGEDLVVVVDANQDDVGHLRSVDGGESWRYVSDPDALELPGPLQSATSHCLTGDPSVCVRTVPGLSIEESNDGGSTWRVVYSVEPGGHLARFTNAEFAEVWLESSAVAELSDGSIVVVMGQLDPAVRSPSGVWSPDDGRYRSPGGAVMVAIVLATALMAAGAALWGLHRKLIGSLVVAFMLPLLGLAWTLWFVNDTVGVLLLPFGVLSFIGVVTGSIVVAAAVLDRNRRRTIAPRAMVVVIAGPILAGFVALVPLLAWRADLIRSVGTALLVLVTGCFGGVATGIVTRRLGGPAPGPPPPRLPPAPTVPPTPGLA